MSQQNGLNQPQQKSYLIQISLSQMSQHPNELTFPARTLDFIHTIFHKFLTPYPFNKAKLTLHSICTLPYCIYHTCWHCSYPPICHFMCLLANSLPQHALMTTKSYSMSKSLTHISIEARRCYSLNLFTSMGHTSSSHICITGSSTTCTL